MSERIVSGYCDPKFAAIEDELSKAIQSGFDTGTSVHRVQRRDGG